MGQGKEGVRTAQGRVVLGLTHMGGAAGRKRAMTKGGRKVRNVRWLSKAEEVQRRKKLEPRGGAGACGKIR